MKVVVSGTRDITNYTIVKRAIDAAINEWGVEVTEIVNGAARGVDKLADRWARERGIKTKHFGANWTLLGSRAGPERNQEMADYGDALIAIWDMESDGTKDMITRWMKTGKQLYIYPVYDVIDDL